MTEAIVGASFSNASAVRISTKENAHFLFFDLR